MNGDFVNKISVKNLDDTYTNKYIGVDSDHVEVDSAGKTLTTKIEELESATPDIATETTAGIVKPGTGLTVDEEGSLSISTVTGETLKLQSPLGTEIGSYDGSEAKTITITPVNHSSSDATYGLATSDNYGHVKTSDIYNVSQAGSGIALSAKGANNLYTELLKGCGNELTQEEYDNLPSESKNNGVYYVSDEGDYEDISAANIKYDNSSTSTIIHHINVQDAIDELAVREGMGPHASTDVTKYGGGTSLNYGHVKLSDAYTTSAGNSDASVGASSYALAEAYAALSTKIDEAGMAGAKLIGSTSLNNIVTSGFYYVYGGSTALAFPGTADTGYMLVISGGPTTIRQFFFKVSTLNTDDYQIYSREINTTTLTYGDWVRTMTSKDFVVSGTTLSITV